MRWANLIFYIFVITILTIELVAVFKLYESLANRIKYNNLTNTTKRNAVVKLRFDRYLRDFNKTYSNGEYKRRLVNFKASLKEIAKLNKLEGNTVFGLTKFSDMSKEEFVDRMLLKSDLTCNYIDMHCTGTDTQDESFINKNHVVIPPKSYDWRKKPGVVKPVLNQKQCRGCWAFSIIGVLESMSVIQKNDTKSRSIQELLDCSNDTNGCYNGSVSIAMRYICLNKMQFVTEDKYPLKLYIDQVCKLPKTGYSGRRVKHFRHVCNMNEADMVRAIYSHGPIVVAVNSRNWHNYMGGIITRACSGGVGNHVVQIVGYEGYGELDAETIPYYIARNSWGEDWGDKGYVKIAMKHGDIANVCGIAEEVTLMDVM